MDRILASTTSRKASLHHHVKTYVGYHNFFLYPKYFILPSIARSLRGNMEDVADRRRQLRAAGAVLASCALCAVLAVTVSGRPDGSSLLADLPSLAPLQQLHWVNHEFRKVQKTVQSHLTALEKADDAAERKAEISAHWGTLAVYMPVSFCGCLI